ncbi:phage portal protein, partial [Escherichia coli]
MMGIMPNNVGGFGDVEKAAKVFVMNELLPIQKHILQLNEWAKKNIISFSEYSVECM